MNDFLRVQVQLTFVRSAIINIRVYNDSLINVNRSATADLIQRLFASVQLVLQLACCKLVHGPIVQLGLERKQFSNKGLLNCKEDDGDFV